jgi:hypothetical protein
MEKQLLYNLVKFFLLLIVFTFNQIAFSQTFTTIGTSNGSNINSEYPCPLADYWENHRAQYLIRASEITAAGIPAGATISSISFNVPATGGIGVIERLSIYVGGTATSSLGTTFLIAPTQRYGPTDYTPVVSNNTFPFFFNYTWNGSENVLVQICNGSSMATSATTWTDNAWVSWQSGLSFNASLTTGTDDNNTLCATTIGLGTQTTRPIITFGWNGVTVPSNNLVCNATAISCGQTLSGSTINSTLSGTGEGLNCGTTQTMPGVWFSIPGNGQPMTASLCGTSWDSKISVFSGSSCSSLTCIGGDDDNGPSCSGLGAPASYSWNSSLGINYYILVHGYGSNSSFSLSVSCSVNVPTNPTGISISETSGNNPNDGIICSGVTAQLSVSGSSGTTYWFSGSCGSSTTSAIGIGPTINVTPITSTTYYARNYSNGLWSSICASTVITVNSVTTPTTLTSNSPQCASVTINQNGSAPNGVTWYWQGTSSNGTSILLGSSSSFVATVSGVYYLRAMNAQGCWSANSSSISVTVVMAPTSPANPIVSSSQCNSATLTRSGVPPTGLIWYWQGTNSNGTSTTLGSGISYNATSTGTYYIRALSNNGCWSVNSGLVSVALSVPSAPTTPTSNSPQCASVTINQNGTAPNGVTWYWQGGNFAGTSTSNSSPSYTATSSGIYYLRARNSAGCWSNSNASINVLVSGYPSTPSSLSSNSPDCEIVTINRNGTPSAGDTWYWQGTNSNGNITTNGFGSSFNASTSGTYYLRAYRAPSCWSQNSSAISVTVFNASNTNLNINACDSYTSPSGIQYSNSGQYQSIITNANGCDSTIQIQLTINPSYNSMNTIYACENYTWSNGITYNSNNNNALQYLNSIAGCDSIIHLNLFIGQPSLDTTYLESTALGAFEIEGFSFNQDGVYTFSLTDQYGCDSIISLNLHIEPLGIESTDKQRIFVYPNPSSTGIFNIESTWNFQIESVIDVAGKPIFFHLNEHKLEISNNSKGIYFIKVKFDNGEDHTLKLCLQ